MRRKILQVIVWIETIDRLPVSIMKSIESVKGLCEIRITFASNIYRRTPTMAQDKKASLLAARTLDELLDAEYGKVGTPSRDQFNAEAEAFCLAVTSARGALASRHLAG